MPASARRVDSGVGPTGSAHLPLSVAASGAQEAPGGSGLAEDDLLIEEISIDGMCGVY